MYWSGGHFLSNFLPAQNSLLVLVYHRIGNAWEDLYDPGVFSAADDEFDDQLKYLKKNFALVGLDEARAWVTEPRKEDSRCRVLVTFDDGYLDNYQVAFPILRSHGVPGVFFLSTSLVGSSEVPWWDEIAFLIRTTRRPEFSLSYPSDLTVNIARDGLARSIRRVIDHYKRPQNTAPSRFLCELREAIQGDDLPMPKRRFLDWDEAKEMIKGGMTIGSHCHSHQMLSKLSVDQQQFEMIQSRSLLRDRLGSDIASLAYPVGIKGSFSDETQAAARTAGYTVAFSYDGGVNLSKRPLNPYDVKRVGVSTTQDRVRFRVQAGISRFTGKFWP
jgi:peptidoglycan/xylan/chitin deacetylase (PgdA/CDA1 family)